MKTKSRSALDQLGDTRKFKRGIIVAALARQCAVVDDAILKDASRIIGIGLMDGNADAFDEFVEIASKQAVQYGVHLAKQYLVRTIETGGKG